MAIGKLRVVDEHVHETADGKRLLLVTDACSPQTNGGVTTLINGDRAAAAAGHRRNQA